MATRKQIMGWLEWGREKNATHLIVVTDASDGYTDYPVFVLPHEDARKLERKFKYAPNQHVMEVYNLSLNWIAQLREKRSYNF
jgi:hypothetical protein